MFRIDTCVARLIVPANVLTLDFVAGGGPAGVTANCGLPTDCGRSEGNGMRGLQGSRVAGKGRSEGCMVNSGGVVDNNR